ncbi:preprotein translocase subunit YajC [Compostimonas suwonensis]|uniref:Preprotein translocase subunit YajC n=1 Tax=Compostimonas suwonensis TaxID=1048394 RepID=A0A2M9BBS2_9MICO|nr:preprotein translocase subunit YajC [Compostimonas suwonensis]PJJ55399.1 preprotein translocase subunit YajC [Compostimonas suwonensis]
MPIDPLTIIMLVVLALLVFFMFRNSRKRQRDAQNLQSKMVVGADVMTNFGVYGTILSIDEDENQVLLETTPGTILKVHRQTIARVITPDEPVSTETDDSNSLESHDVDGEPAYGERIDPETSADDAPNTAPGTSNQKKVDE